MGTPASRAADHERVVINPAGRPRQLSLIRLCANCDALLSRYNRDDDDLCQTCRRRWAEKPDYDPRTDPGFVDRVAALLLSRYRRRVLVARELDVDTWVVNDAVKVLRRAGFVIVAHKGVAGYTLTGWRRPDSRKA